MIDGADWQESHQIVLTIQTKLPPLPPSPSAAALYGFSSSLSIAGAAKLLQFIKHQEGDSQTVGRTWQRYSLTVLADLTISREGTPSSEKGNIGKMSFIFLSDPYEGALVALGLKGLIDRQFFFLKKNWNTFFNFHIGKKYFSRRLSSISRPTSEQFALFCMSDGHLSQPSQSHTDLLLSVYLYFLNILLCLRGSRLR